MEYLGRAEARPSEPNGAGSTSRRTVVEVRAGEPRALPRDDNFAALT
jgi:hypothetical protein